MKVRVLAMCTRCALFVLLVVPAVLAKMYADVSVSDARTVPELMGGHLADLRVGEVTDGFVLAICLSVMAGTWLRILWVVFVVLLFRRRDHKGRIIDRPLTRFVLRLLVIAPVVTNPVTSRAEVHATSHLVTPVETEDELEFHVSLRDAVLVSAAVGVGVSHVLRRRRLEAMRSNRDLGDDTSLSFEDAVTRHGEDVALARLDLAARSLVAAGQGDFRWLVQHSTGLIHVECARSSCGSPPWGAVSDRVLVLDAGVSLVELSRLVSSDARSPLLVPVGTTSAGDVWVNLDLVGSFFVEGSGRGMEEVWQGLCQSIALSPLHGGVHLIGEQDHQLVGRRQLLASNGQQIERLSRTLESDESPCVVLVREATRGVIRLSDPNRPVERECGLVQRGSEWLLEPLGQPIRPTACTPEDLRRMVDLIGSPKRPIACRQPVPSTSEMVLDRHPFIEMIRSEASFVARAMGRPCIEHQTAGEVEFERSRSEELVLWLAFHPRRRLRSAARADIWSVPIKDATFSNLTSDVRRSLAAFEEPPQGEQWLAVTMTDEMPLHRRIVTDAGILERCIGQARRFPEEAGAEVLEFGLGFVRGCPLEGSNYLWRDATGIATDMAMLIVRASMMSAEMALEIGDIESVHRYTAKGLVAVPGHEGLVSMRMRQHALCGDRSSLTAEWESYCRTLSCDDWGDARPSPAMVDLWRELSGRTCDFVR